MTALEERFWAKVNKTDSCWLWTAVNARIAAMTWQPIETAPKDGTWVLLQGRFKRGPWALPVIGVWSSYSESWQDYESRVEKPTHWMPLPEPPR